MVVPAGRLTMNTRAAKVLAILGPYRSLVRTTLMRATLMLMTAVALSASVTIAQSQPAKMFDVYVIDVEGGNATLFVSPSGESLLMDTGNVPPGAVRDAGRIVAAAKAAGLKQIDHLIITHWHGDHFGGLAELAPQIPIKEFIDHGPNVQPGQAADDFLQKTYPQLIANAQHTVAKPGDKIRMGSGDVTVVSSARELIKAKRGGAGPRPYCPNVKPGETHADDPATVGSP